MNNSIANFQFVKFSRPPMFGHMHRAVRTRPGVSGAAVLNLGAYAKPFDLEALSTHPTVADALATFGQGYLPLTAAAAVPVTFAELPMGQLGARYFVLAVEILDARAVIGQGRYGTYGATLRTNWQLQPA